MTVERRTLPDRETLRRAYMEPCRPFVVSDLFAGDPLRDVNTLARARELWGDVELRFRSEYLEAFLARAGLPSARAAPPRVLRLAEYLDASPNGDEVDATLLCSEEPTPPAIAAAFAVPSVAEWPDDPPLTQLFAGRRGQHAQLHFDGDGRHGFLYQVYGRKRVMLFPAAASRRLLPFGVYGGWFVDRLSAAEREDLLAFARGCEVVLEPGEALFIPAFAYHYVEYVDDAMSLSLDFGRNRWVRLLAAAFPHTSHMPIVGARLLDPEALEREHPGFLAELERRTEALPADARERRGALEALAGSLAGDSADAGRAPLEEVLLAAEAAGFRRGAAQK